MTRALAAAIAVSLLAVSGAGGSTVQEPRRGGTVVLLRASQIEPSCLNPLSCGLDPAVTQVLEGAYEVGPDLVVRPNLVSGVEIGRKPFTLTYRIRREARWSDGTPVTAADFRFTHQQFAALRPDPDGILEKVRSVQVLDAKTVRVFLHKPFAQWQLFLFDFVLPHHALAGRDLRRVWSDRIDDPRTGRPLGSGPFLVGRWERGERLTLVRNPRYWGPHPAYLDRLVYRFARLDPLDPLAPLRRNELDVAIGLGGSLVTADVARRVRALPGWSVEARSVPAHEHLTFRVASGSPLADRRVRQAIAFGIDRDAIARELLSDLPAFARAPPDSATFTPAEPGYRPAWSGYRYDEARARRLLGQAGCRRGSDGVYACAGERLRLRFVTTAGDPERASQLELVRAHLAAVGIEVLPQYVPPGPFFNQLVERGDFDAVLFAWAAPPGGFVPPEALCGHEQNWGGFCSRLVTRDAAQADRILDPALRALALHAADRKLAAAVPILPLRRSVIRAVRRTNVRGMIPAGPFELVANSEDWWLADR